METSSQLAILLHLVESLVWPMLMAEMMHLAWNLVESLDWLMLMAEMMNLAAESSLVLCSLLACWMWMELH